MDKDTIDLIDKRNETLKKDMIMMFQAQTTAISARVDMKIDQKMGVIHQDIRDIKSRQDEMNGWVKDHTERLEGHDDDISELQVDVEVHNKILVFFKKNWLTILVVFMLLLFGSSWGATKLDHRQTLENKTGLELKENPEMP